MIGLCSRCDRQIVERDDTVPQNPYALSGVEDDDICAGCMALIEHEAAEVWCWHCRGTCVVPNHYVGSVHLCREDACIEDQDITTLMINASFARWKEGEPNDFFDRMKAISEGLEDGSIETVPFDDLPLDAPVSRR